MDAFVNSTQEFYSDDQRQYYEAALNQLSRDTKWDYQEFKRILALSSQLGAYPAHVPDSIDLGPLRRSIDELTALTRSSGVEWGRPGLIDIAEDNIKLGRKCRGNELCVAIEIAAPKGRNGSDIKVGFDMHTHPELAPHGLHLSGEDYKNLLLIPTMLFSIVAHRGRTIIALKTAETPRHLDAEDATDRIADINQRCLKNGNPARDIRLFTEAVAQEFGMALFVSNKDDPSALRRVVFRR